jgi:hypothetical protein
MVWEEMDGLDPLTRFLFRNGKGTEIPKMGMETGFCGADRKAGFSTPQDHPHPRMLLLRSK